MSGLDDLAALLGPDPASARRAGPGARLNPVFVQLRHELLDGILFGQVGACEHVQIGADDQVGDLRWFAASPAVIRCGVCAWAYAATASTAGLVCHGCRKRPGLPQVFATAGRVLMVADCCNVCVVPT